jgi:hypothetical protein
MAWRPLAYIPDQDLHYSKQQRSKIPPAVKMIRNFKLFNAGLKSFIEAQQSDVLRGIYVQLGDKAKRVNLKIPLAFIIGDNMGGDQISGRRVSYGLWAKRISRTCDATPANYADVDKDSCTFLEMDDIKKMVLAKAWHDLENLYQAQCWNPFFDVDYGANIWGIFFAACPPEALHALEQGVFKHLLESILGGYLKPVQMTLLDRVVQMWTRQPRQRLFRSSNFPGAPRIAFKDGISSLKHTPGCDRAGMVFALAIASLTRDGREAFHLLDKDVTTQITYALEMLLCYWAWLKQDVYWNRDSVDQYEAVKDAVSTMLHELINCVPRETGNGWNIPKIHEQLHVPCYIQMFGAHRNLHTGPAEHNHIELSKQPAKRTQKRAHVFDWQVANRLVDKLVVDLADFTMQEHVSEPDACPNPRHACPMSSAVFDIVFWNEVNGQLHADLNSPKTHGKFLPPLSVLHCLADYCINREGVPRENGKTRIRCFTERIVNNVYLRTNPAEKDGAWFDNVLAEEPSPLNESPVMTCGNLRFMFCFPDQPTKLLGVIHRAHVYQPTHSVLTKMYRMEYEDDPCDLMSCVNRSTGFWKLDDANPCINSEPSLSIIDLDSIKSHVLLIPYHENSKFMLGVLGQSLWADLFVTY